MIRRPNQNRSIIVLVAPAFIFVLVFFVLPLIFLLSQSVLPGDGGFTLTGYADFFESRVSRIVYLRTLKIGLIVTGISVLMSYPAAFLLARMPARRRSFLMLLVILPLMTNAVARTFAWLIILGKRGMINQTLMSLGLVETPVRFMYTETAIVLGLTQLFLPLMVLPLVSAMENIPDDVLEAARSLGANRLTTFVRIVVPLSSDGLVLGATLVFTGSVTAFVTPAILGGSRLLMMSTLLRQKSVAIFDQQAAAVIAVVMILTTLAVNLLLRVGRVRQV
ncbi:MAG: ABC transporter permease [Chloroflexi bacterium]|nr:ABC transporter permease [Chloroflexota bacterium]